MLGLKRSLCNGLRSSQIFARPLLSSPNSPVCQRRSAHVSSVDWDPIKVKDKANKGSGRIWMGLLMLMPVISFGLGTWQVQRLKWKQNLISRAENTLSLEPLPLPPKVNPDVVSEFDFRRVIITGTFRHDQEMLVGPRTRDGQDGYFVITPLERPGGSKLLINRGWIAKAKEAKSSRELPKGEVTIECLLREKPSKGSFALEGKPEQGMYHYLDIDQMAARTGSQPIYIQQLVDPNIDGLDLTAEEFIRRGIPIGAPGKAEFRNSHFQYIVTWYGLSIFTFFMLLSLRKSRRMDPLSQKLAHARSIQ